MRLSMRRASVAWAWCSEVLATPVCLSLQGHSSNTAPHLHRQPPSPHHPWPWKQANKKYLLIFCFARNHSTFFIFSLLMLWSFLGCQYPTTPAWCDQWLPLHPVPLSLTSQMSLTPRVNAWTFQLLYIYHGLFPCGAVGAQTSAGRWWFWCRRSPQRDRHQRQGARRQRLVGRLPNKRSHYSGSGCWYYPISLLTSINLSLRLTSPAY